MAESEAVGEARALTAEALNVPIEEIDYITDELLAGYEAAEDDPGLVFDETGRELSPEDIESLAIVCRPMAYGNRLTFTRTYVGYKQGDPGTVSSYACGTRYNRKWGVAVGDEFIPLTRCPGSTVTYYRLCRPALGVAAAESSET